MSIVIEAIYEAGSLKLLSPLPKLPEHTKVRLTIEPEDAADLRFPTALLTRIKQRREAVFQRCGMLPDSTDLIREGRDEELE